jgi:hypothetical protein
MNNKNVVARMTPGALRRGDPAFSNEQRFLELAFTQRQDLSVTLPDSANNAPAGLLHAVRDRRATACPPRPRFLRLS